MNKEEIKELFELLFNDNLTDFGKRKLQEYVEIMHQKLDNVEMVKRSYEKILFKNSDLSLENTNLKQALIDIKEYVKSEKYFVLNNCVSISEEQNQKNIYTSRDKILQIINKVLGGSDE